MLIKVHVVRKGPGRDELVCGLINLDDIMYALEDWSPLIDGPASRVFFKSDPKHPITIQGNIYQLIALVN